MILTWARITLAGLCLIMGAIEALGHVTQWHMGAALGSLVCGAIGAFLVAPNPDDLRD